MYDTALVLGIEYFFELSFSQWKLLMVDCNGELIGGLAFFRLESGVFLDFEVWVA